MEHNEIRIRILHTLYQRYYGGGVGTYYIPKDITYEAGLDGINDDLILGDIIYLKTKNLLEGLGSTGTMTPAGIMITVSGIDMVEKVMGQSLEEFEKQTKDKTSIKEIEEIKKESTAPNKWRRAWQWASQHPEFLTTIISKVAIFFQ